MTQDSIVVITGAARGIGFELFKQCLARGAKVVAGVRSPERADELHTIARKHPAQATILPLDVTSDASTIAFAERLRSQGFTRVDVLINNAGVYLDGEATLESLETAIVQKTFETNVFGLVRVTRSLLPLLRNSAQARVATISSLMGSVADNSSGGSYAYRMSKSAANMFAKTLACDERELISLSLHPGWVKTSMGGDRAPLAPEKSAEGLITVIETATSGDSGKFFNHAGRELPW